MKHFLAALIVVAAIAPSRAQDFFGISPGDAEAMIGQAKAQEHEERLRSLGWQESRFPSIGAALGYRVSPASNQACIYDAVFAHLRADSRVNAEFPDILYARDVDTSLFQAAYKGQFPSAPVPAKVQNVYMSNYNVIYVDDEAGDYKGAATIDAAMAAQFARYIDTSISSVSDQSRIDADAAAVQSWYQTQYPAGTTSCTR
jgi:hypothetical protein